jgi:hypothetical protein
MNLTECTRHKNHCENGDKLMIICSFRRYEVFDVKKDLYKADQNNTDMAEVYLSCQLKNAYEGDKVKIPICTRVMNML